MLLFFSIGDLIFEQKNFCKLSKIFILHIFNVNVVLLKRNAAPPTRLPALRQKLSKIVYFLKPQREFENNMNPITVLNLFKTRPGYN